MFIRQRKIGTPVKRFLNTVTVCLGKADVSEMTKSPLISVFPSMSIRKVTDKMARAGAEAAIIVSAGKIRGIFTMKDLVRRVLARRKCLINTKIEEVMTVPVNVVMQHPNPEECERVVEEKHAHYLPIVDNAGKPVGLVSALDLLRKRVEEVDKTNEVLAAYVAADGIGG